MSNFTPYLEETIYVDFITSSPSTGAAADADSLPTCAVYEQTSDTALVTPTVVKRTSLTGNYRVPVVCTAANGFEVAKSYSVVVSATVGAVAAKAVAANFQVRDSIATELINGTVGVVGTVNALATDAITAASIDAGVITELRAVANGASDSGTTTTMVDAARTEADTDYWAGDIILFTSGTIYGQARVITGFVPATDTITFTPATTQAVGTHSYEILPGARAVLAGITHTLARVPNVTLADTVTTYTGNTPQTGDSFPKTNSLTFTVAGQVDSNVQSINDVTITGDGQVGTEFGV